MTVKKVQAPLLLAISQCKVVLLTAKPPFFQLRFLWPGTTIFLKIHFVVSKWPKFYNLHTFFKNITDLIHLRPHQTLCSSLAF